MSFWKKLGALRELDDKPPKAVSAAPAPLLPDPELKLRLSHRIAGLGSLGRQRFVAIAEWRGGRIAREAKAWAPSAAAFAAGRRGDTIWYDEIVNRAVRAPDPFVTVREGWVVRRLAPDCARVEPSDLPKTRDEGRLLHAMGRETANIHLGTRGAPKAIRKHLKQLGAGWLKESAQMMSHSVESDWQAWGEACRAVS